MFVIIEKFQMWLVAFLRSFQFMPLPLTDKSFTVDMILVN